MNEYLTEGGFGLYFHWPFCSAKCPYCDFNSHVVASVDQARWQSAFVSEIERVSNELGPRCVDTVFFGGGTPSLMDPSLVASVLDAVRSRFRVSDALEVTIEANPTSVEAERFAGYKSAGVNRVSLGVQALDDDALRLLGRLHSVSEALSALTIARDTFDRVSFDLMYARQFQSEADWTAELELALDHDPDHLSLYQLTIEPGTAFGERHARGRLPGLPSEDRAANMFLNTQLITESCGLPAYEISNHARAGSEARHNLIYWTGGDYAGIGPGAHGRLTMHDKRYATETPEAPSVWLKQVEECGSGEGQRVVIPPGETLTERFLMGLRLRQGVLVDSLPEGAWNARIKENVRMLAGDGWIAVDDGYLRVTEKGRPVLNSLLGEILR